MSLCVLMVCASPEAKRQRGEGVSKKDGNLSKEPQTKKEDVPV